MNEIERFKERWKKVFRDEQFFDDRRMSIGIEDAECLLKQAIDELAGCVPEMRDTPRHYNAVIREFNANLRKLNEKEGCDEKL